jgi:hypothetical protein
VGETRAGAGAMSSGINELSSHERNAVWNQTICLAVARIVIEVLEAD